MKKGQILEGVVNHVAFPNKSRVTVKEVSENGVVTETNALVKGALPGQTVSFVVKKARKDKCQGRLKEVIKKSPLETVEPMCPNFGTCGGCNYQTLPYETQLEIKKKQVLELIDKVYSSKPDNEILSSDKEGQESSLGNDNTVVLPCKPVKDYVYDGILSSPDVCAYRNKMEFTFGDEYKGGPLTLGLHKKGSFHDIVNASGCKIVHEDFTKVLDCVREYCAERGLSHYNKNTHEGVLRHLLVRRAASTGELLVALVTSSQMDISDMVEELGDKLLALNLEGSLTGFIHIINDGLGDVVKSDETRLIRGKDWFTEEILGLKFRISPFSFFQTNTKGAEVLYSRVRDYIVDDSIGSSTDLHDKVVFDLYSGTGTIAQIIAPIAKKVIGVEIVEEAVEAARKNATENGLTNCEFIAGDVLKVIDEITEKPDFIILDPPREGIHPKAIRRIIDFGVENIVYVSCKPTSLANDLAVFEANGYHLKRVSNVDMFPQTVHVETVVLLGREKVNEVQYAYIDYETKDAEYLKGIQGSATYKEIKAWIKQEYGINVTNLYIAQIKDKCGFEKRKNYYIGSESGKVPICPPEKEKAILGAFKHFNML